MLNGSLFEFADILKVSQAQKIFRSDTRYYSDHKTMESINATKKSWMDIMPRKSKTDEKCLYAYISLLTCK
jgi:hypothetical protein